MLNTVYYSTRDVPDCDCDYESDLPKKMLEWQLMLVNGT
jgi:hypothetical protein